MTHALRKNHIYNDISLIVKDCISNMDTLNIDYQNIMTIVDYTISILSLFYDNEKKLLYSEIIIQFITYHLDTHLKEEIYDFNNSITINREILEKLKVLNKTSPPQKSDAWYEYRYQRITASDIGSIFNKSPFKKRKDLLLDKCKDIKDSTFVSNKFVEHGNRYELCATNFYEHLTNCSIYEFGCLPHKSVAFLGASPDGISEDGIMLEIKCPFSRPIHGVPPIYYWYQIQIQLEVANLPRCDYLECKITEMDIDDFNKYVKEKNITKCYEVGFIIMSLDTESCKNIYDYFTYGEEISKFSEWKNEIINKIMNNPKQEYVKTVNWVLEEYGLCKIYRDTKWYKDNFDEIKNFWDDVKIGRQNGIVKFIETKRKQKPKSEYLMVDSESDPD